METLKVRPWGKDQGDHVIINAVDFDPEKHERIDDPPQAEKPRGRPKHKQHEGER